MRKNRVRPGLGGKGHVIAIRIMLTLPGLESRRYIFTGFANGILILAVCAFVWLTGAIYCAICARGGLDPLGDASRVDIPAIWLMLNLGLASALIVGSVKVRRLSRIVGTDESSQSSAPLLEYRRRLRRRFLQIAGIEWAGVVIAFLLGILFHRQDLIWPGASLIVCLHFVPLGSLFHLRPYYFLAAAGLAFCLIALLTPAASMNTAHRLLLVGAGVGFSMWITAAYNVFAAHRLARNPRP
jgi:hypothetical protein